MYRFACKDLGVDCEFVATGPSPEELKSQALSHAGAVHAGLLQAMTDGQKAEMVKALEAAIQASAN